MVLKHQIEALNTGKDKIKSATCIGSIGAKYPHHISPDILVTLSGVLENDPDHNVKEAVSKALLAIGTEPAIEKLNQAFKSSNVSTRLIAVKALLSGKKAGKDLRMAALKDPDPNIRSTVASDAFTFKTYPELTAALLELLTNDSNRDVQYKADHMLTVLEEDYEPEISPDPPLQIPPEIKACLEDIASGKDSATRQAAADKLIAMGKKKIRPVREALLELTAHEDPDARYYTAVALKGLGDKTNMQVLRSGIYYEENVWVRQMMQNALQHLESLPGSIFE